MAGFRWMVWLVAGLLFGVQPAGAQDCRAERSDCFAACRASIFASRDCKEACVDRARACERAASAEKREAAAAQRQRAVQERQERQGRAAAPQPSVASTPAAQPVAPAPEPVLPEPPAPRPLNGIERCDQLAGHPDDPEAFVKGLGDDALNAMAVISACEEAVKLDPASPRLSFQLARGYLKAERTEDAIEQLLAGAKQGHGASLAYLADLHLDGAPGIEADPAMAHVLYERALASGFVPAKAVLAQFEDYTDKAAQADKEEKALTAKGPSGGAPAKLKIPDYEKPDIMLGIERGALDSIKADEFYTKDYLAYVAETIAEECGEHFDPKQVSEWKAFYDDYNRVPGRIWPDTRLPTSTRAALENIKQTWERFERWKEARGDADAYFDEEIDMMVSQGAIPLDAMQDGFTAILKHGCGTDKMKAFAKNIEAFVSDAGAPRYDESDQDTLCYDSAKKAGEVDSNTRTYCRCHVNAHAMNFLSRGTRKALYADYWGVTKRLKKESPARYVGCGRQ